MEIPKMDKKQFGRLLEELTMIKNLLVLDLQHNPKIKGELIAKALGISQGRLSQMMAIKKYKKKK